MLSNRGLQQQQLLNKKLQSLLSSSLQKTAAIQVTLESTVRTAKFEEMLEDKADLVHTHAPSAITQGSATTGQVLAWNGSIWAAATVAGGGGVGLSGTNVWTALNTFSATTASTSSATGALLVSGGVGIAKDSYINGHKIGRGAGDFDTNIAIGRLALGNNTGTSVTAIGVQAADVNIGSTVLAIGYQAAYQNKSNNLVAIGSGAGVSNTGVNNVFVGGNAGTSNNASNVVAIGFNAASNSTASALTAIGSAAGAAGSSQFLVAIGPSAGYANSSYGSVAIGYVALSTNSSGHRNTAIGSNTLDACTTGGNNTGAGSHSLGAVTTGAGNTALGGYACDLLTTGSNNVVIGFEADVAAVNDTNSIVIGKGAVGLGTNTTVIGVAATTSTKLFGSLLITGDTVSVATQKTPASATATGTKGDIAHDSDYIYVCTATNTWKRVAISTW